MRHLSLLCCAAALGGCGLLIDPVQGTDAGTPPVGMDAQVLVDAGASDAGPAPSCESDDECDDGQKCNGLETCDFGECRPGTPIVCDDGIGCTEDVCDEAAGGCVHTAVDSVCPEPALECAESWCDPEVGCQRRPLDAACDDGVACTADRCSPTGCESQPVDADCPAGQYCQPDVDDGPAGCLLIPDCEEDTDCPRRICNEAASCDEGRCVYSPLAFDPACSSADECVPIGCEEGRCVIGARVTCPSTDAASCTRAVCERSEESGDVSCVTVDRDGESCPATMPCHAGVCEDDTCVETSLCPASTDPCEMPVCDATGGCGSVRNTCGTNSSCRNTDGRCVCDPGWTRCDDSDLDCSCAIMTADAGTAPLDAGRPDAGFDAGGRDAGSPTDVDAGSADYCLVGEADCDGDGRCECVTDRSRCDMGRCTCLLECPLTTRCCPIGDGIDACVLDTGACPTVTP